jgi:hypothetical protein
MFWPAAQERAGVAGSDSEKRGRRRRGLGDEELKLAASTERHEQISRRCSDELCGLMVFPS